MGVLDAIAFLFSYRRKVYKIRKSYDRVREKTDKIKDPVKRTYILKSLDQVEPSLIVIEEQRLSRFERARMMLYVKQGIEQARQLMREGAPPEQYAKTRRR